MGEMADLDVDMFSQFDDFDDFLLRDMFDFSKYWKMKDGNLIKISDMTTSHLLNVMKMLDRKNKDNEYIRNEYLKRK